MARTKQKTKRVSKKPSTQEFFNSIVTESPYIAGDDGTTFDLKDIPWADPQLIKEGQEFVQNNFFAISLVHMAALLYGFSFKPLTSVLLRTGGFGLGDKTKSMLRHVETGLHIQMWYKEGNMDKVFKDIQIVRKLHFNALRKSQQDPLMLMEDVPNADEKLEIMAALKKDLDSCVPPSTAPASLSTYNPPVFLSQYDMLMTQFGFVFGVVLFPKSLGIRDTKGIRGFLHLWAVFGKMLGIQDRFNLTLNPDQDLFKKLFYELGMASLKDMDLTILHLQQTYIDAISPIFKCMTLKSAFYAGLLCHEALPDLKTNHFYKILSWKDWIYAKMAVTFNRLLYHSSLFRNITNVTFKMVEEINQANVLAAKRQNNTKPSNKHISLIEFTRRFWEFVRTLLTTLYKA